MGLVTISSTQRNVKPAAAIAAVQLAQLAHLRARAVRLHQQAHRAHDLAGHRQRFGPPGQAGGGTIGAD